MLVIRSSFLDLTELMYYLDARRYEFVNRFHSAVLENPNQTVIPGHEVVCVCIYIYSLDVQIIFWLGAVRTDIKVFGLGFSGALALRLVSTSYLTWRASRLSLPAWSVVFDPTDGSAVC